MSNERALPLRLPKRPSLEHLRKQAKELLRDARQGDAAAVARLRTISAASPTLSFAQLAVARSYGFTSWTTLVHHVEALRGGFALRPLIRPTEMTDDDVYAMFVASRAGDLDTVKRLVSRRPALATHEYNYTPPIHFAAREGHRQLTEFLLDHGADVAYRSYPFNESLLTLAEDHEHHDVAHLLRERLARRFRMAPGAEAILDAAKRGDVGKVEQEIARHPAIARASNETGDTALHQAAKHGHRRVVETLLDAGADVDAVAGNGHRPIHSALMPNWFFYRHYPPYHDIVDLLLARGARYNVFIAAMRGDFSYVREAVARDVSLANFEDTCHDHPVSAAARRGDVAMTRFLLDHAADPNLPETGAPRGTALWSAVTDRNRELVELLLAHGADPNASIDSCGTPMGQAEGDADLVALLVRHGGRPPEADPLRDRVKQLVTAKRFDEAERIMRANPRLIDFNGSGWGDGVLAGPARDGDVELIAMLMRLGATVPTVTKWAPYYYFKHESTARFLLEHGMNANHMNWHRFTLLHHMSATGELGKAQLLLDHDADIDAIDDEYRSTPLGVAARGGQAALVDLLLERGADPEAAGAAWATPLAWARRKGHASIAARLERTAASP